MRTVIILLLFTTLNACISYSGPKDRVELSTATTINELGGIYLNTGEPHGYLSQFIWGRGPINSRIYRTFLNHRDIKYIKVIPNEKSIIVKAIVGNCSAYEKEYFLGSDFEINHGEIILSSKASAISRGAGDPLVGPSFEKTSLSLDTKGNGIYTNQAIAAGLIYLLVPAAISDKTEIRFMKTINNKSYIKCYDR